MTNEELVMLIQSGERDRLIELWQQIRRMALKEAVRWAAYRSNGVELDDLEQAGFIALMRAVDGFDPAAGALFSPGITVSCGQNLQLLRGVGQRGRGVTRSTLLLLWTCQ